MVNLCAKLLNLCAKILKITETLTYKYKNTNN